MTDANSSKPRERRSLSAGRRYSDGGTEGTDVRLAHLEERLIGAVEKLSDFINEVLNSQKENAIQHEAMTAQLSAYKAEFEKHTTEEKWWRRVVGLVLIVIAGEPFIPLIEHVLKAILLP